MSREIPADLKTFKEKVGNSTSTMSSTISSITSKIDELSSVVTSVKSQVEGAYKSSTDSNQALTKLDNTNEIISSMKSDIQSTFSSALDKSEKIIRSVTTMEELVTTIKECEDTISSENKKENPNQATIISKKRELSEAESDFDKLSPEAQSELTDLKNMDKSLEKAASDSGSTGSNSLATYTEYLDNLKYGTFTRQKYTSPNTGKTIEYYLYIPDYGTGSVPSGLPVFMYMHGGGSNNYMDGWVNYGLTKKIGDKEVTPSGIVICPFVKSFTDSSLLVTLKDLTDEVVSKYNCDTNRISVGGHSFGAITSYRLINKYPDYYAACVPISGWDKVTDAFDDVNVWAFHGEYDNNGNGQTTLNGANKAVNEVNSKGGTASITVFEGMGHAYVQNKTFEGKYTSPDGKQETALEWVFRQSKAA
jgi:predicted peptidase